MTASALRALLAADRVTHVPGVHDPVTAVLAVRAGNRAVHLSGAAVSATMLGRPDLDFVHATQIADRASTLVPALGGVPVLADADTGYGNPVDAVWTALAYARAGISGLLLDDRAHSRSDNRPHPAHGGRPVGKELITIGQAAAKITTMAEQAPEMVVIAGTGAHPVRGLDETILRCRAYAEAGADAVHPEGVETLEDLARVRAALPGVPMVINRSEPSPGTSTVSDADLARLGVRLVLHPVAALLAAMRAASLAYRAIADTGSAEPVDRMPWAAFTDLVEPEQEQEQHESPAPVPSPVIHPAVQPAPGPAAARPAPWIVDGRYTAEHRDARYVPGNLQT
ncbi:isocitrate lyase/PEP mutase family protein [Actinoplanes couchii]|uniref:Carboxyvinyl-carboxyphosphonate phosphorylmutase n=1 Tax=Actinoplanes couchii TaxID=403638 RepID=A0ABQ3XFT0_9ACTN|nr:isocitrate lyase/PEP mutase family protein [Actinoplanes couchii]MDR6321687.1 methylisocitrate lyase [Actinoplanes couchii]GID57357.1 carboxyvinyl-carboxyphosphonate phosphorylmutase [Actinoplanes couchii]